MTAPMLMTQHPTEELLAEYIDDRLDSTTREPVTDHLASCGECREIVLMANAWQVEESANVRQGVFGKRPWLAPLVGLAAAAAIAVAVVQPSGWFGPDTDDLMREAKSLKYRPSPGRLAGDWAYGDQPQNTRGGSPTSPYEAKPDDSTKLKILESRVKLENAKFFRDQHALGLARLLTVEEESDEVREDVTAAVTALDSAYKEARGEERDAIAIDLAAALIQQARRSSQRDQDHARALELSNDVLTRHPKRPEALWNRAVVLESTLDYDSPQQKADAIRAWDDYLKADPSSQWAEEAMRHKAQLADF